MYPKPYHQGAVLSGGTLSSPDVFTPNHDALRHPKIDTTRYTVKYMSWLRWQGHFHVDVVMNTCWELP